MTACQICCKVKPHCSCIGSETPSSSCTLEKAPFHAMHTACSLQHSFPTQPEKQTLDIGWGPANYTGWGSSLLLTAPFLKGREGMMNILQLPKADDDALGPQGLLKRQQQQPLPDLFIQPGTSFLCSPKLSWGKRAVLCHLGTGCIVALAEHASLVLCGSAPHNKRNFTRKTPSLDGETVSNQEFTATPGKLFHTVEKTWCLPS